MAPCRPCAARGQRGDRSGGRLCSGSYDLQVSSVRPARPSPPLVLIPGAMATAVAWRYQISAFRSTREVIVPDQHFALETIQAMAQDIAPRLPPFFDLVGWSMGG